MSEFDVVIVGGRPAGATLAARLGRRGLRVLVVDRARFPSQPAVPSSPVVHPGTMHLLDELGIDEASYGHPDAQMRTLALEFHTHFHVVMRVPVLWGRDYIYGIHRHEFDLMLWERLAAFPSITRRDNFAVTELIHATDGRVVGIIGGPRGAPVQKIRAACVVGADGRFSLVARKAGAPIIKEEKVFLSTFYYANWEGATPFQEGDEGGHIYTNGCGLDVPMFRMPGGQTSVNVHMRADRVALGGDDMQRYYESVLQAHPCVWRRLKSARQVSSVLGLKRIGNGYRSASGPGWVLVGDALHYKDPVDGQGIYDALLETRLLDCAIDRWHRREQPWEQAMSEYERAVHAQTSSMFEQTLARLRRELYQEPPRLIIQTMLRWLMTDPVYQSRFMHYLARTRPEDRLMSPGLVLGTALRGIGRDVRGLWRSLVKR